MALIANVNRDPKKGRAFTPADFDPFSPPARRGIPITADSIEDLKVFCKNSGSRESGVGSRESAGSRIPDPASPVNK